MEKSKYPYLLEGRLHPLSDPLIQDFMHSNNITPVLSSDMSSSECDMNGRGSRQVKPVKITNKKVMRAESLPLVINCNPRLAYGKQEELKNLISQYSCPLLTLSESWNRDDFPLSELIQIENYKVITNVKECDNRGGRPAIIINEEMYHIKELCPQIITVPVGVKAVWVLIRNKSNIDQLQNIIVCSYYYAGPKTTPKNLLFDHLAESINFLSAKYGQNRLDFILSADSNRLNLDPIAEPQTHPHLTPLFGGRHYN